MGKVLDQGHLITLRSAYLRSAQDAIRQYHADAVVNGLCYDRDLEEQAVEGFAHQISVASERYLQEPGGGRAMHNWTRVLSALPDFPHKLRDAVAADASDYAALEQSGRLEPTTKG
jgi:glucosyl-3-phosphoglycerate synthase